MSPRQIDVHPEAVAEAWAEQPSGTEKGVP